MKTIFSLIILSFILLSCSIINNRSNMIPNLKESIIIYLTENVDSIINKQFIFEGQKIKLSPKDINIYISEERMKGVDVFLISGSVVRFYNQNNQPDYFETIDFKGEKIRVFYDFVENNNRPIFNFDYNDKLDMLYYFSDHPKEWLIYKCKNVNGFEILKNVSYITENDVYKLRIDKNICK